MNYSLIWLHDVLLSAGLKVAEVDGWRSRGHREMGSVRGVMCHHTGGLGPGIGSMTSLDTLVRGRRDLPGPLSQLGLGRDGTFYVIAAGVAFHAGKGQWHGRRDGNSSFVGIEAENSGLPSDIWPEVQMEAYRRGVAAILRHVGAGADMCIAHREWAPSRKIDPRFDISMDVFRAGVRAMMAGTVAPRPPIPATASGGQPTLRRGDVGQEVGELQAAMKVPHTGTFNAVTEAAVRAFQRSNGLVDDGIVGPKTWAVLVTEPAAGAD